MVDLPALTLFAALSAAAPQASIDPAVAQVVDRVIASPADEASHAELDRLIAATREPELGAALGMLRARLVEHVRELLDTRATTGS